jgi:hypothetical protein
MIGQMTNRKWKGLGRKQVRPNQAILESDWRDWGNLCMIHQDNWCRGQDSNQTPPEQKSKLNPDFICSVCIKHWWYSVWHWTLHRICDIWNSTDFAFCLWFVGNLYNAQVNTITVTFSIWNCWNCVNINARYHEIRCMWMHYSHTSL